MIRIILFAAVFLLPFVAGACECLEPTVEDMDTSYKEADIIAEVTIDNASGGWNASGSIAKLTINHTIKNKEDVVVPQNITANFNNNFWACGMDLENNMGEKIILGLYDTRSVGLSSANSRGYGFRILTRCHQDNIRKYLKIKGTQSDAK